MSELPIRGLTEEERLRQTRQLYLLMGKQVKSYHKAHHMGENTSVPVELARELMESLYYTLGHTDASDDLAAALERGQEILKGKHVRAVELLRLVNASVPAWQVESRWEAISLLTRYLKGYDPMHLAHRAPEPFAYPLPVPEELRGIDCALCILRLLCVENEIMDAFPQDAVGEFWDVFCQNDRGITENQCQRLILNGAGKWLLRRELSSLVFQDSERETLKLFFSGKDTASVKSKMENAAGEMAAYLGLGEPYVLDYMKNAIGSWLPYGRIDRLML